MTLERIWGKKWASKGPKCRNKRSGTFSFLWKYEKVKNKLPIDFTVFVFTLVRLKKRSLISQKMTLMNYINGRLYNNDFWNINITHKNPKNIYKSHLNGKSQIILLFTTWWEYFGENWARSLVGDSGRFHHLFQPSSELGKWLNLSLSF